MRIAPGSVTGLQRCVHQQRADFDVGSGTAGHVHHRGRDENALGDQNGTAPKQREEASGTIFQQQGAVCGWMMQR